MCDLPSPSYKAMIGYYINRRGNAADIRVACLGVRKLSPVVPLAKPTIIPASVGNDGEG